MSKQREALKLALDALRGWIGIDEWIWPVTAKETCKKNSLEAITAICEALAEQEQKPIAVVTSQTGDPVTMSWHHEPALPIGTKLYAAPPARKPLTDSELWEMWVESPSDVLRFARAIERAHGITE